MINTKLSISFSLLIIIIGSIILWFGLQQPVRQVIPQTITISPEAKLEVVKTEGQEAFVTRVIDGDTIELEGGIKVRLLGIDTPETKDPRRPVGCFGKEAANKTKELLEGKMVILQKDISETDKYNRLLRYIFLPLERGQLLFVNDYLIREGFAQALTYPPDVKYNEQFREAERFARENKKGLWGSC